MDGEPLERSAEVRPGGERIGNAVPVRARNARHRRFSKPGLVAMIRDGRRGMGGARQPRQNEEEAHYEP